MSILLNSEVSSHSWQSSSGSILVQSWVTQNDLLTRYSFKDLMVAWYCTQVQYARTNTGVIWSDIIPSLVAGVDPAFHTLSAGRAYMALYQSWFNIDIALIHLLAQKGGGPRVVVSTAAFHAKVRGSVPGLGGLKETKMFLPHLRVKVSIVGSLRDREVACSASDRQGSNFESCVWRTVSSQSSHHPQEVLLAQFSLYVHKGGLKARFISFTSSKPAQN